MLVPKGPLLFLCYALISLSLLLPAEGSHCYSFSVSLTSVDGIHLAYSLFFTLL